ASLLLSVCLTQWRTKQQCIGNDRQMQRSVRDTTLWRHSPELRLSRQDIPQFDGRSLKEMLHMSLNGSDREDTTIYKVVVNHEEQYSLSPEYKTNPLGWRDAGKSGSKAECLAYIKEVWTDMRPLSLRKKMEEFAKNPPPPVPAPNPDAPHEKSLVERL